MMSKQSFVTKTFGRTCQRALHSLKLSQRQSRRWKVLCLQLTSSIFGGVYKTNLKLRYFLRVLAKKLFFFFTKKLEESGVLPENVLKRVEEEMETRWNLIGSPVHPAAYLLEPHYQRKLLLEDMTLAYDCLEEMAGDDWKEFQPIVESLVNGEKPFDRPKWKDSNDLGKWTPLYQSRDYNRFAVWALSILQIRASTADLERSFNPVRMINNHWRRKLKKDNLRMMVFSYFNQRQLDKVKI